MTEKGDPAESDDDMEPTAEDGLERQTVSDDSNEEKEEDESVLPDGNAKLNKTNVTCNNSQVSFTRNSRDQKLQKQTSS